MKYLDNLVFFIIFFFAFTLISCDQKKNDNLGQPLILRDGLLYKDSTSAVPFTGRHKSRVMDKIIEYEVKDGIKNGDFILYYPNGKIEMQGKLVNDKNEGEWKYYLPDGTLQTIGIYVNDLPESTWTWFYQDGKIFEQGNFKNGIRVGEWKTFDQYGKLRVLRKFENGEVKDSTVFN